MKQLHRAVRQNRMGGRPLPSVFQAFADEKILFRRSEVSMLAGPAGAGKSLLALWHGLVWARDHSLHGLYLSADSAELGQAARALAMHANNLTVTEAETLLKRADKWAVEQMQELRNLAWSFDDDLTYENIAEEVEAYVELWGTPPDFIIVDNLTDVEGQSEDEWATQRRALKALVQLARSTDAMVLVLHHTTEDPKYQGDPCPPRNAIMGRCAQKPALILTTADKGKSRPVACVKNRFGWSDKGGYTATWLHFNQNTMHFDEW